MELLTPTQAAKIMDCTRQWVHKLIKQDRLRCSRIGRAVVIRRADLDRIGKPSRPRGRPMKDKKILTQNTL